jgi:hypothetical protein
VDQPTLPAAPEALEVRCYARILDDLDKSLNKSTIDNLQSPTNRQSEITNQQ